MKRSMIPLHTQEQFETDIFMPATPSSVPYPICIQFSASWCGPCKKINSDFLVEEFSASAGSTPPNHSEMRHAHVTFYKCDIDENKYTPGYCGVRSIPNFVLITGPKKLVGPFQSSDTAKIATWIFSNTKPLK